MAGLEKLVKAQHLVVSLCINLIIQLFPLRIQPLQLVPWKSVDENESSRDQDIPLRAGIITSINIGITLYIFIDKLILTHNLKVYVC